MSLNLNIRCEFCNSNTHPTSDCPVKNKQRAITGVGKHDPKSMLALTEITAEEEIEAIVENVRREREARENIKSLTFENIQTNATKSYHEQQDV